MPGEKCRPALGYACQRWRDGRRQRRRRIAEYGRDNVGRHCPAKRQVSGAHLIQNNSQSPNISRPLGSFAMQHLRSRILQGSCPHPRLCARRGSAIPILKCSLLGQAEIENFDLPLRSDHHIGALQIAMQNVVGMGICDRICDLNAISQHCFEWQSAGRDRIAQAIPGNELKRYVNLIFKLANVVVPASSQQLCTRRPCRQLRVGWLADSVQPALQRLDPGSTLWRILGLEVCRVNETSPLRDQQQTSAIVTVQGTVETSSQNLTASSTEETLIKLRYAKRNYPHSCSL